MRLFWDFDLNALVIGPGSRQLLREIECQLGFEEPVLLQCSRNGIPEELPLGSIITFGFKLPERNRSQFVAKAIGAIGEAWAAPANDDALFTYSASVDFTNPMLLDLLSPEPTGTETEEEEFLALVAQLSCKDPTNPPGKATQKIAVTLWNNVNKGDESEEIPVPASVDGGGPDSVYNDAPAMDGGNP